MRTAEDFNELWQIFQAGRNHAKLNHKENGVFFQKIRSIDTGYLKLFLEENKIETNDNTLKGLCKKIFLSKIEEKQVDDFILKHYPDVHSDRQDQIKNTKKVVAEIRELNWNIRDDDVNKLIQRFVRDKTIKNIDNFIEKIDKDLLPRFKDYIIWSYYNQTTNDIIENIVFTHKNVLPSLRPGGIKDLDFFFMDEESNVSIPFDLKTSYINQSFFDQIYEKEGIDSESEIITAYVKENGIKINGRKWKELLEEEILTRGKTGAKILTKVLENRGMVIDYSIEHPDELIQWLYKDQGPRLFNNNNRFFIILFDKNDYNKPWKLKSEFELLKNKVYETLDNLTKDDFVEVEFVYDKSSPHDGEYKGALATIVFICPTDNMESKNFEIKETQSQKYLFDY